MNDKAITAAITHKLAHIPRGQKTLQLRLTIDTTMHMKWKLSVKNTTHISVYKHISNVIHRFHSCGHKRPSKSEGGAVTGHQTLFSMTKDTKEDWSMVWFFCLGWHTRQNEVYFLKYFQSYFTRIEWICSDFVQDYFFQFPFKPWQMIMLVFILPHKLFSLKILF